MELSNLWVSLGVRYGALTAGLLTASRAIGTFASNSRLQLAKVNAAFAGLAQIGTLGVLTAGLTAFAAALLLTVGPAIQFETAFAKAAKTIDATEPQLAGIREGILDLSREMPAAATEIAAVAEAAGQLGIATPDILTFTETMVQLGTATNLSAEQAAISMARFINVMGESADSVPILGAALVELGNNSATTESEILSLGQRIAGAGNAFGLTGTEVLAFAAGLSSMGIQAEVGGSTISRVMVDIIAAVGEGGAKLEAFAAVTELSAEGFEAMLESDPSELLLRVFEGLGQVEGGAAGTIAAIQDLGLNSIRLRRIFLDTIGGGDLLRETLNLVGNEAQFSGALLNEYGRLADTTAARIDILGNRLRALAIDIGTPTLGAFAAGADAAGDAVERLADLLGPLASELSVTFSNAATAVGIFFDVLAGPALATAGGALLGLVAIVDDLTASFNSFGPAGAAVLGLVATLTLVPGVAGAARAAVSLFAFEVQILGLKAAAAQAGIRLFNVAVQGLFVGTVIAGLALLGKAYADSADNAREAGDAYKEAFSGALAAEDAGAITTEVANITNRITELKGEIQTLEPHTRSVAEALLGAFGGDIQGEIERSGESIEFANQKMRVAQDELEVLETLLRENGWEDWGRNVTKASRDLGLSGDQVLRVATEMGILDEFLGATGKTYNELLPSMTRFISLSTELANELGVTTQQLAQGTVNMNAFVDSLGIGHGSLEGLARLAGDVNYAELLFTGDPEEKQEAMNALWIAANSALLAVASAAGITKDEYLAQRDAVVGLAAAHDGLQAALARAQDAMAAMAAQQEAAATAQSAFEEGLAGLTGADGLPALIRLMGEANIQNAGAVDTSKGLAAALFEAESGFRANLSALLDHTGALKIEDAAVLDLVASLAGIPIGQLLVDIVTNATEQQGQVDLLEEAVSNLAGEYLIQLLVENEGSGVVATAVAEVTAYAEGTYNPPLDAHDGTASAATGAAQADVDAFTSGVYNPGLEAHDAGAAAATATAQTDVDAFTNGVYDPGLEAHDAGAAAATAVAQADVDAFASGVYDPGLEAHDAGAAAETAAVQGGVDAYEAGSPYSSTLTATDNASGVIRGAVNALGGFVSKHIFLTATNLSGRIGAIADGAILYDSFAGGGLGFPNGATAESPGLGQIYRPTAPGRFFAEPETGGEAYIPLAPWKRNRSMAILHQVASMFGQNVIPMAGGGILGAGIATRSGGSAGGSIVNVNATIPITIADAGGDPEQIRRIAREGVIEGLNEVAADLDNTRLGF